ncbi:MAG: HipA domain-containing protein [Burkholderiaceae bacterium]|nr:HipA domain-containing protein [Burkholderiaceae bacterium]
MSEPLISQTSSTLFIPQDTMHLWWLADPKSPKLIGDLRLADRNRRVSLTYDAAWLQDGFALSEDLPLVRHELLPPDKDRAAGAVDDARPDRWGERVIRLFEKPGRLSLMEYLYLAGDDRTGALGVSRARASYLPYPSGAMPSFDGLDAMAEVVRKVLANEPVPELQKRLLRPGASMGGARPKSIIELDGEPWIIKFSEGESLDTPLIEHASMTLARICGINTADTRALAVGGRHAVAIRRFDRVNGGRLHVLSANVALKAAGEEPGYPELAQLLRRLGEPARVKAQQEELFRRMVFNIVIDNTDDHEKNHALVRTAHGNYQLSPAYDVLPTSQGLRYQQMRVGQAGSESTLANALSEAQQFGLTGMQAKVIVKEICLVVDTWRSHLSGLGVIARDLDDLSSYLDGDFLRRQRARFTGS